MENFLVVWTVLSYAIYVFLAERFSPFPPKRFSHHNHGKLARRRKLGYWAFAAMAFSGILVSVVIPDQSLINKSLAALFVGSVLGAPGLVTYMRYRIAT